MKREEMRKLSVLYSSLIATLSLYYGIGEILKFFISLSPYVYTISLLSLYPMVFLKGERNIFNLIFTVLIFFITLLIILSNCIYIPDDLMGGFVLILSSSLLFTGMKETYGGFFSGLSFYIVGLFLLLGDAIIQFFIFSADMLDHYINCIGVGCGAYNPSIRVEIFLFLFGIPALYPFFARWSFRRRGE